MEFWSYLLLVAFVSMVVGGVVANARGADGAQGLAAGLLLGPLGVAVAFVMPLTPAGEAARQVAIADALIANGTHHRCTACGEAVRKGAIKCAYCQSELPPKT